MATMTQQEREQFTKSQSTGNRAPNMRHGRYTLMIDRWTLHRGYMNALSDIHNFIVMRAEPIVVRQDDKEIREEPNEVWSRTHATIKYAGPGAEMAGTNSTRFTLALLGLTDAQITADEKQAALERMTNDDPKLYVGETYEGTGAIIPATNPCRGMLIAAETSPIHTRKGNWIVAINWIHIAPPGERENSYPAAAQRWAEYEARFKQ